MSHHRDMQKFVFQTPIFGFPFILPLLPFIICLLSLYSYLIPEMSVTCESRIHALWWSCRSAAVTDRIISGKMVSKSDTRGENWPCIHVTFSPMLTRRDIMTCFSSRTLIVRHSRALLNLTPYIGRNVLCVRLPAFIHWLLNCVADYEETF